MKSQRFSLPFPAAAFIILLLLSSGCIGNYVANRDIVVVRISPDGETDWAETLDYGFDDYTGDIAITYDGGCIVAGKNASGRYGDYISRLIRFSPGGEILWDKTLPGSDGSQYYSRYSVVQTHDGGFAVLTSDGAIFRTGPDGELLWRTATGIEDARSLVATSDGGFAAAGLQQDRIPFGSVPVYGENGNVTYRDPLPGEVVATPGCHETVIGSGDNAMTVTECTVPVDTIKQAAVVKVGENGSVSWKKAYGAENLTSAWTVAESPDGGNFFVAGYETTGDHNVNTTSYAAVLLLDGNGTALSSDRLDRIGYYTIPVICNAPGGYDIMYINTTLHDGHYLNRLAEAHFDAGKGEVTSLRIIGTGTVFARTAGGEYLIAGTSPGSSGGSAGGYRDRIIDLSLYDSGGNLLRETKVPDVSASSVEKVVPLPGGGCMILALKENFGL
ncbi:hypothetical protein [Methanolacinia paynteri]|uniref:hypothetical protein n=1 Tax=Methanolacinia paynteri TaxID=230356 RepID=UPI0012F638CF|nr:hypothetical protein [Methanolacinia paynteri]